MKKYRFLRVRLDLFDGGSAGAGASGSGGSSAAGTAVGTVSGNTSGVKDGNGVSAAASPAIRSRSKARSGVYDNVKFGKQPTAEGAINGATSVGGSDAGNDGKSAENSGAEARKNTEAPKSKEERRRAYDEYIKGEGKEFYAEDTQQIISKRHKDFKAMEEKMSRIQPFMDALGDKYNLSSDDLDGLMKAIQGDRDFFAEAAAEAGMDNPETYRQFKDAQRKSKAFEEQQKARAEAEENARRQSFVQQKMQDWHTQADALKSKYPNFNFEADTRNPQFMSMLRAGVSVEAAYRAMHHDEIVAGQVASARSQTEKSVVDNIRAKGARPVENGTSNTSTFTYKSDVSKLSRSDRAEIARRVARGENIEF